MSGTDSQATAPGLEVATLGGGCFWCLDAVFRDLRGVAQVHSGYAGGHVANPNYEQVCGKRTGHAEVVQVTFDPREIGYADLLRVFFTIHDPTTKDRQGNDVGPQYRSVIYYHDAEQERIARDVIKSVNDRRIWNRPVVTEVSPLPTFYPAEAYHQDYAELHPDEPYIAINDAPKVVNLRKQFPELYKDAIH